MLGVKFFFVKITFTEKDLDISLNGPLSRIDGLIQLRSNVNDITQVGFVKKQKKIVFLAYIKSYNRRYDTTFTCRAFGKAGKKE